MSIRRRCGALLLLLCLLLPMGVPALAADPFSNKVHQDVDYADMALETFDDSALQAIADQFTALYTGGALKTDTPQTRAQVEALYSALLEAYAHIETQYYLWGVASDAHAADQALAHAYLDYAEGFDRAADLCWDSQCLLTDTPYEDILDGYPGPAPDEDGPALPDEGESRERALYLREEALIRQYQQVMAQEVWSTPCGTWSWEELEASDLRDEDYERACIAMEQAENQAAGPIFLELVALRQELAALNGYDSYTDYAYEVLYGRDYTPAQAEELSRQVSAWLAPVYDSIYDEMGYEMLELLDLPGDDGETIWQALGPCLEEIHPALGRAWQFMMDHHLYDVEASPAKTFLGYTVPLAQYGTAFIFNAPYGSYLDYASLIHEFGHFAQAHYDPTPALWAGGSIDLGELHSQALEVLFTRYAETLFPGQGEGFTWATLLNMVESALDGCMYDQFQQAVYALEEPTLEEVNLLFKDISQQYGYTYGPEEETAYFWVETAHNFSQPFYYISYATSALSSIDLWLDAQTDWEGAVETYMTLLTLGPEASYTRATAQAGLGSVFGRGAIPTLAGELTAALTGEDSSAPPDPVLDRPAAGGAPLSLLLLALAVGVLLGLWLAARLRRKGRAGASTQPGEDDPWVQDRREAPRDASKDPWE